MFKAHHQVMKEVWGVPWLQCCSQSKCLSQEHQDALLRHLVPFYLEGQPFLMKEDFTPFYVFVRGRNWHSSSQAWFRSFNISDWLDAKKIFSLMKILYTFWIVAKCHVIFNEIEFYIANNYMSSRKQIIFSHERINLNFCSRRSNKRLLQIILLI